MGGDTTGDLDREGQGADVTAVRCRVSQSSYVRQMFLTSLFFGGGRKIGLKMILSLQISNKCFKGQTTGIGFKVYAFSPDHVST